MSQSSNPAISVVIPIFDSKQHLHECLGSIQSQSYGNFEALLIDDGSNDGSADICRKYVCNDPRFAYFRQTHSGKSNARNTGIQHSSGAWICFVDSDDYLPSDAFEHLISCVEADDSADIAIGEAYKVLPDGRVRVGRFLPESAEHVETVDLEHLLAASVGSDYFHRGGHDLTHGVVWGKLYSRNLLIENSIEFDDKLVIHEDVLFNIQCFFASQNVKLLDRPVYCYRIRNDSAIHRQYGIRQILDIARANIKAFKKVFSDADPENESTFLSGLCSYKLLQIIWECTFLSCSHEISVHAAMQNIKEICTLAECPDIQDAFKNYNRDFFDRRQRFFVFIFKHHLHFLMLVMVLIKKSRSFG